MLLKWLNASQATSVGVALADDFVIQSAGASSGARHRANSVGVQSTQLHRLLQQVDREARPLHLNMFKRAKLVHSFKWRLIEKGMARGLADELTQAVLLRLSTSAVGQLPEPAQGLVSRRSSGNTEALRAKGDEFLARGANAEAIECYQQLLRVDPRNAVVGNNLGVAFCRVGQLDAAEAQFRKVIGIKSSYADAHCNLGNLLRTTGRTVEAEMPLRRALNLKPTHLDAQVGLGTTLFLLGRLPDARELLEKALKIAPRNLVALIALGDLAAREGRFADAEALFRRALEIEPKASGAWAGLAGLRRMTAAEGAWLRGAEASAAGSLEPVVEANIRYAIGKYYDDIGDYSRAFRNFQRANELQRTVARPYDRQARTLFVDDLIRAYTRECLSVSSEGASDSSRPVFVVGMPRSGTSLVEQIIASHPAVRGAGELEFWTLAMRKHEVEVREAPPRRTLRMKLAKSYLHVLAGHSADARHVIDKSPLNSEYLGVIHNVFPKARAIYVQRDPIDTCLSCYFQEFSPELYFSLDLADLVHFYREHQRIVGHWRRVLPPGTLFEVPYEGLIVDQEGWTRRILDFLGLEWDERCLNFYETARPVRTASYWQVRQKLYQTSAGRWRHYQKFIGPLLSLSDARS